MIQGRTKYVISTVWCILFSQVACFATDYYVDASVGSDSNSGKSTTAPWRTLAKVNSYTGFVAGDHILLSRGRTWREQLTVPVSGVSGSPVVFGAYGTGSKPMLKGSALVTNWGSAGSSRWSASLGSAPNQVFFNGVRGTKRSGTSSLTAARDWYWGSGVLYVYATSDPDSAYTAPGIEASIRPSTRTYGIIHIAGRQYVTIQDIDVSQSASYGVYIRPTSRYVMVQGCDVGHSLDGGIVASTGSTPSTQISVINCSVHHNNGGFKEGAPGVATYHEGLTMEGIDGFLVRGTQVYANYMEGSNFKRGARNGIIENCLLYANGLINQYLEGATNIQIRYNKIYDCTYNAGIEFGLETNTYSNDTINIYDNLFWGNSGGISFWSSNVTAQHRNISIYNNTFFNNWEAIRWKSGATDNYSGTNYIRNNLIWQNSTGNWAIRDYTTNRQAISRTTIAYNAFQQGSPTDTAGTYAKVISNPYFANAGSRDFHLTSSSACVNAGTSVGLTRDFDGTAVPQGNAPDLGAYEYASGTTTTYYTLTVSATNGTVTKTPNQTSYASGTSVSLQATPGSGYTFTGWSGALTGSTNPATLVMNSNKSVTANFALSSGGTTTKTVGITTVFSSVTKDANRRAMPYTMAQAGQLQSISIYQQGGSGRMILAVYADSSGKPGTRLGVTSSTTVNSARGWQKVNLQSPVSVSAGQKIWLAWVFERNPGIRYTRGTPGRASSSALWAGGMPTTFGTSTVAGYIYSIYATYSSTSSTAANYTIAGLAADGAATETPSTGKTLKDVVMPKGKGNLAQTRGISEAAPRADTPKAAEPGTGGSLGVVAAPSGMMLLHVRDTGKGINPASVTIEVDGNLVYSGDVQSASTAYGDCIRTGTKPDYTYLYQPKDSSGRQIVVAVNARDPAGNVLPEQTYLFNTATAVSDQTAPESNDLDQSRPSAVNDSKGNTWSIWQAGEDGQRQIYISRISNGVETAADTVQLTQGQGDHTHPAVAVDGAGVLYAVWQQNVRGHWNVYLSVSADGKAWSAPKAIVDANDNQVNPAIAASGQPNGLVAVLWQQDRADNQDLYLATSSDAFTTAEVTAVTSDEADQTDPAVFIDGEDALFMRWMDTRNDVIAPMESPQEL